MRVSRVRRAMVWRVAIPIVLGAIGLGGCTSATMTSYFAAANLDAAATNAPVDLTFYRVTIDAHSFLTKSSFQTGFYDADALHQLFGEVKKPDTTQKSPAGQLLLRYSEQTKLWELVDDRDRFAILYGANADAIAGQLQLFAESDTAGKQLASLFAAALGGDTLQAAINAEQALAESQKSAGQLATTLRQLATQIKALKPDTPTKDKGAVRALLLQAGQTAAKNAGSSSKFDTSDLDKGFAQAEATYETLAK